MNRIKERTLKYFVLEISKNCILYLSESGFTDNKNKATAFSEKEAERLTSEYNREHGDLSKTHYNFVEAK